MNVFKIIKPLVLLGLVFLTGCNLSNDSTSIDDTVPPSDSTPPSDTSYLIDNEQCSVEKNQVVCSGGYSYWVKNLAAISGTTLGISGVTKSDDKSLQWISFFDSGLTEKRAEIHFSKRYKADEHNAPSMLPLNGGAWLVARTGHSDTFGSTREGEVRINHISSDFKITLEQVLLLDFGATYVQLAQVDEKIFLLTRDATKGWGVFVSNDLGTTWSKWHSLSLTGRNYTLMDAVSPRDGRDTELVFSVGRHPSVDIQQMRFISLSSSQLNDEIPLSEAFVKVEPLYVYETVASVATNERFLDSYVTKTSFCSLRSYFQPSEPDKKWQLYLDGYYRDLDKVVNFDIGSYYGALQRTTYITGASFKNCSFEQGEETIIYVAEHNAESELFQLIEVKFDGASGVELERNTVYESTKQLYRPVYIPVLDYLMFNESEYWNDYKDWRATQKVIRLSR